MPSTDLSIEQRATLATAALQWSTSPQEALKAAKRLAGSWPHARPPDPEVWAASLAAALSNYPLGVVQECCDPRVGLARSREFPPTVACIVEWCDVRVKRHRGAIIHAKQEAAAKVEKRQYTDEHGQTMLQRLSKLMHNLFDPAPSKPLTDAKLSAHYPSHQQAAE